MTLFNLFWNLTLGIIGGIISSIIVTKIFLIQNNYREQLNQIELLIQKLGYIGGMFFGIKAVLEFSHDSDIEMKKEMEKYGYKTEDEYYAAHSDRNWISKDHLLKQFLEENKKMANAILKDIMNTNISEKNLYFIVEKISNYARKISTIKEYSFSMLRDFDNQDKDILHDYNNYKKRSNRIFIKMILKDKVMMTLYTFVGLILIFTIITYYFHL